MGCTVEACDVGAGCCYADDAGGYQGVDSSRCAPVSVNGSAVTGSGEAAPEQKSIAFTLLDATSALGVARRRFAKSMRA